MGEEDFTKAREALAETLRGIVGEVALPRFAEALTHPSYSNETGAPDNQRLEFLGDSVLGLCVSEMLLEAHPTADEGTLTRMRAALVNADALARWGRSVSLGDALALGRGARASGDRDQTNVIADAVEALVAAFYEAAGHDAARRLVAEVIREPLADAARLMGRDPKSALQERVQAYGLPAPVYRVQGSSGPKHEPTFQVEAMVGDRLIAQGEGRSKRIAERAAAEAALELDDAELRTRLPRPSRLPPA
ncbi:MAG: ribonuclease III [Myxococcales bacterium]|nr:ribonuclease III [Myxococcales bacterium]